MSAEKTEHAWQINGYVNNYIQVADTKAASIIAVTALGAGSLALLPDGTQVWGLVLIFTSFMPLLVSLILALVTLYPRTRLGSSTSTVFWGGIKNYPSVNHYKEAFYKAGDLEETVEQNYYLAKIAARKFKWITLAVQWQVWGVPFFLLSLAVVLTVGAGC